MALQNPPQADPRILSPKKDTVKVEGKLFYNEGDQAWNMLRLKKEILAEFPNLKEKQSKFGYMMLMNQNFEELQEELNKLSKQQGAVPILLYLVQGKN